MREEGKSYRLSPKSMSRPCDAQFTLRASATWAINPMMMVDWLIGDWRQLIPQPWTSVIISLTAVLCGSLVGLEREQKEKPAGMLTLTLVSLGAATFTMVSFVFQGKENDSSRVAAQVVT